MSAFTAFAASRFVGAPSINCIIRVSGLDFQTLRGDFSYCFIECVLQVDELLPEVFELLWMFSKSLLFVFSICKGTISVKVHSARSTHLHAGLPPGDFEKASANGAEIHCCNQSKNSTGGEELWMSHRL